MSLLYKDEKDIVYEASIKERKDTDVIEIEFSSDCGKFGTHETLAGYKLTPLRLLKILQEREDITDEEYN